MAEGLSYKQYQEVTKEDFIEVANQIKGNIVMHFKGDNYLVLDVAESATSPGEVFVVYKALYGDCNTYIREVSDFFAWVEDREENVRQNKMRFEPIRVRSVKKEVE